MVVNPYSTVDPTWSSSLAVDPSGNAIVQIPINPGDVACSIISATCWYTAANEAASAADAAGRRSRRPAHSADAAAAPAGADPLADYQCRSAARGVFAASP